MPNAFVPPPGYVAINDEPQELWSVAAKTRADELLAEAEQRDPDRHDMYLCALTACSTNSEAVRRPRVWCRRRARGPAATCLLRTLD